jgi:hypothetical protein
MIHEVQTEMPVWKVTCQLPLLDWMCRSFQYLAGRPAGQSEGVHEPWQDIDVGGARGRPVDLLNLT